MRLQPGDSNFYSSLSILVYRLINLVRQSH